MNNKKQGLFSRAAKTARHIGSFYIWTVAGNFKELRDNTKRIKDGFKGILNRHYRHESFEDVVQRLNLSEDDLNQRADFLAALAFLFGLIAVIAFFFLLATPLSPSPINHAMMSFGVAFVAGAKYVTTRFRVAQIRARNFFDFSAWFTRNTGAR